MQLADTFAVLKPDRTVEPVSVTPTPFADLDSRFDGFRGHVLVSEFGFSRDWPTWERHPRGDEVEGTENTLLEEFNPREESH